MGAGERRAGRPRARAVAYEVRWHKAAPQTHMRADEQACAEYEWRMHCRMDQQGAGQSGKPLTLQCALHRHKITVDKSAGVVMLLYLSAFDG